MCDSTAPFFIEANLGIGWLSCLSLSTGVSCGPSEPVLSSLTLWSLPLMQDTCESHLLPPPHPPICPHSASFPSPSSPSSMIPATSRFLPHHKELTVGTQAWGLRGEACGSRGPASAAFCVPSWNEGKGWVSPKKKATQVGEGGDR